MLIEEVESQVKGKLETVVDQLKLSEAPVPALLVGGGSILVGDGLSWASEVIRPDRGDGPGRRTGEGAYSLADVTRQQALDECRSEAIQKAIASGAGPETVEIVETEEIPMTYLPGNATRVRVKAVGDLKDS